MVVVHMVTLYRTLPMLLINRFAVVSTGWNTMSSAIPAHPATVSPNFSIAERLVCTCTQNSGCVGLPLVYLSRRVGARRRLRNFRYGF